MRSLASCENSAESTVLMSVGPYSCRNPSSLRWMNGEERRGATLSSPSSPSGLLPQSWGVDGIVPPVMVVGVVTVVRRSSSKRRGVRSLLLSLLLLVMVPVVSINTVGGRYSSFARRRFPSPSQMDPVRYCVFSIYYI